MNNIFGEYLKSLRQGRGYTLRRFCEQYGFDPGNLSRLERGVSPPPEKEEKIAEYAKALGLKSGSKEWRELLDRAAASRGRIPGDLLQNKEIVGQLPLLFRTLRGKKVSVDKLDEFVARVRRKQENAGTSYVNQGK